MKTNRYEIKDVINQHNYNVYLAKERNGACKELNDLKAQYPAYIFLFEVGDFYEAYCDDAEVCSEVLGIALECRNDFRMAGFPKRTLSHCLYKLIEAGHKAIVCEHIKDEQTKSRVITELVK